MYKQKKNEKSTKNKWKRSRSRMYGIGILIVTLCLTACEKEEHRMEEVQLEEVEKSESDSEERQNQSASEVSDGERQPKTIWVYVSGAVCTPGVYELPEGSRLFEALERAGGMTEAADQSFLNQAELLTDGVQIRVPTKEEVASGIAAEANTSGVPGESGKTSQGKVNLNTATKEELMTLPGIGEAKADSILTYRESAGGFQSIEQIKEIEGIKDGVFEKIKERITV